MAVLSLIMSITTLISTIQAIATSYCTPFHSTFPAGSVSVVASSSSQATTAFISLTPQDSFSLDGVEGLGLFLRRPEGEIHKSKGVNNQVADGATVNSTFLLLYGKVTFEVSAPLVPGLVTAVILISDEHDEMDVELLGGDPNHWQSNVYSPQPTETKPLYGVFGGKHAVNSDDDDDDKQSSTILGFHKYTIDWDPKRIIWSIDGRLIRTLRKEDTLKNGRIHYPSTPSRLQLGIWDASLPLGTAHWAKGPIEWDDPATPQVMKAVIRSVTVEC